MSNDLLTWNCGARDNAWPKKPSPTNLLMRDRQTVSLPPSKAGKRFQCLASKAGRTSSFWMLPTAVCHRGKLKRYRCSQTSRAGNDGSNRNGGGTWAPRETSPQIRSAPDSKNNGTPQQPSPRTHSNTRRGG